MQRLIQAGLLVLAIAMLSATGEPGIRISGAWVRPTPPGAPTAAVYALIENASGEADRLLAVESDAAEATELHEMKMDGGMMIMRPVQGGLAVPAHGTLQLKPGGYHIMLIHPKQQIQPGDRVQVRLVFQHAGRVSLSVDARTDGGAQSAGGMQGMHGMSGHGAGAAPMQGGGMGHGPAK